MVQRDTKGVNLVNAQKSHSGVIQRIPKMGLEPILPKREPDFESGASANSATPASDR